MTERIGHVSPIEKMRRPPQRFNAVLGRSVIFAPCHCRGCAVAEIHLGAKLPLDLNIETHRGKPGRNRCDTGHTLPVSRDVRFENFISGREAGSAPKSALANSVSSVTRP